MSILPPGFFRRQFIYTPPVPTASFQGKTVIITGSNVGLGFEASRWIVRLGASKVILACRNIDKGRAAAKVIQQSTSCSPDVLEVWQLDMNSYASVIEFANKAKTQLSRLDAVLANAGVNTSVWKVTEQDEECITINVVSTALLACLIHPKLRETAQKYSTQAHLTFTSSEMHYLAKFNERKAPPGQIFTWLNEQSKWKYIDRYSTSKLLLMFVLREIASMAPVENSGVIVNCIAPGFCRSSLTRQHKGILLDIIMKTVARPTEVGSRTLVHGLVVGPETHGQYVPDCKIESMGGLAAGEAGLELQRRVWDELRHKLEKVKLGVTNIS